MEKLSPTELKKACHIIHEQYKACIGRSVVNDVAGRLDVEAPTRKCGSLYLVLIEQCNADLATGELSRPTRVSK